MSGENKKTKEKKLEDKIESLQKQINVIYSRLSDNPLQEITSMVNHILSTKMMFIVRINNGNTFNDNIDVGIFRTNK